MKEKMKDLSKEDLIKIVQGELGPKWFLPRLIGFAILTPVASNYMKDNFIDGPIVHFSIISPIIVIWAATYVVSIYNATNNKRKLDALIELLRKSNVIS
jgi:hypothetical protein